MATKTKARSRAAARVPKEDPVAGSWQNPPWNTEERLLRIEALGERIEGDLARPDGAGPFPAIVGLHGCAGMHDTTKQRLADELVGRGYVLLLVDSYATRRGTELACTSTALPVLTVTPDAAWPVLIFPCWAAPLSAVAVADVCPACSAYVALFRATAALFAAS